MVDRSFEIELDRMFADAPAFADSDLFAARVDARLERGWTFRRVLIGGLGLVGGLIGAGQVVGSGLLQRAGVLGAQSNQLISARLGDLAAARVLPGGLEVNGEVIWMSAALAAVAIGFALTRATRGL